MKQLTLTLRPEGYEPLIEIAAIPDPTRHPLWPRERTTDLGYLRSEFVDKVRTENMARMIRNRRRERGTLLQLDGRRSES